MIAEKLSIITGAETDFVETSTKSAPLQACIYQTVAKSILWELNVAFIDHHTDSSTEYVENLRAITSNIAKSSIPYFVNVFYLHGLPK